MSDKQFKTLLTYIAAGIGAHVGLMLALIRAIALAS